MCDQRVFEGYFQRVEHTGRRRLQRSGSRVTSADRDSATVLQVGEDAIHRNTRRSDESRDVFLSEVDAV